MGSIKNSEVLNLQKIVHNNKAVLTIRQIANIYNVEQSYIHNKFYQNKDMFVQNKHYFNLTDSEMKKNNIPTYANKLPSRLNVFTKDGVKLISKLIGYHAIKIYKDLEKNYFNKEEDLKMNNKTNTSLVKTNNINSNEFECIENGLVPVYRTNTGEYIVNARELHNIIKSKRKFADWIQDKIEKYEFVENEDYFSFHNFVKSTKSNGGVTYKDYILKLDVAKEIAMVENNQEGRKVRRYFIEVDKKYKNNQLSNSNSVAPTKQLLYLTEAILKNTQETQELKSMIKNISEKFKPTDSKMHLLNGSVSIPKHPKEKRELTKLITQYSITNEIPTSQVRNYIYDILKKEGYDAYKKQRELGTKSAIGAVEIMGWIPYFLNRSKEILKV